MKKEEVTQHLDLLCRFIQDDYGVSYNLEYRFHPDRKWRFDAAFQDAMIAVEINGGIWISGRHNRGAGYLKDLEKMNAAQRLGWKVFQFVPDQLIDGTVFALLNEVIMEYKKRLE